MKRLGPVLLMLIFPILALGQSLPENAKKYGPILKEEIEFKWPTLQNKKYLFGQVEQESCITLKHRRCWSPDVEFKTHREYGFGLSQFTIVYKSDGSELFNAFKDVKKLDKDLDGWKWENRFEGRYQLRALVVYDKSIYSKLPATITDERERLAFMFSAYNGGLGGALQDRRLCQSKPGCNPNLWFGHVENTSLKQKTKIQGYGKSFFEINREYPRNILNVRSNKYEVFLK